MKYLIVIEKTKTGFSAYVPDLDGCIAAGKTRAQVVKLMRGAIKMHLEGMLADGERPPRPRSTSADVEVPALRPAKPTRREYDFSKGVRGVTAARLAERQRTDASIARKRP